ncbi:MAG: hypothetical protein ACI4R9_04580 [Kiritimatiellia bacterium]
MRSGKFDNWRGTILACLQRTIYRSTREIQSIIHISILKARRHSVFYRYIRIDTEPTGIFYLEILTVVQFPERLISNSRKSECTIGGGAAPIISLAFFRPIRNAGHAENTVTAGQYQIITPMFHYPRRIDQLEGVWIIQGSHFPSKIIHQETNHFIRHVCREIKRLFKDFFSCDCRRTVQQHQFPPRHIITIRGSAQLYLGQRKLIDPDASLLCDLIINRICRCFDICAGIYFIRSADSPH